MHVPLRRALPLLAALAALYLTAPAYASHAPVPKLDWQPCDDGFECATAQVPLDYDHPRGRSIELALIRDPADEPDQRIGSLFINPGGPGESGVEFLREAPPIARQIVGRRFDLVGFDPRGVGASRPAIDARPTRSRAACTRNRSRGPIPTSVNTSAAPPRTSSGASNATAT